MFIGLRVLSNGFDGNIIIQHYQIQDTLFNMNISTPYIKDKYGKLDDIHHLNQLLFDVYDVYRFSNQSVCKNINLFILNTFPRSIELIKQTLFYKTHKIIIDKILERKAYVIRY